MKCLMVRSKYTRPIARKSKWREKQNSLTFLNRKEEKFERTGVLFEIYTGAERSSQIEKKRRNI